MPPNASRTRTISRSALRSDGQIDVERRGMRREVLADLYHFLLTVSYAGLLALMATVYFALNAIFAALYLVGGDNIAGATPGSFVHAYEFSVQTFATIGYGVFAPQTGWAHSVVAVEALVGIVYSAFATGLVFAKFARPTARVLFSSRPVISLHEGVPTLQIRMANGRFNQIMEATALLRVSRIETTAEGGTLRRFHDLSLVRSTNPILALSWTLFHRIEPGSPLYGLTPEQLDNADSLFIVTVTGLDDTVMAHVHARQLYTAEDLAWNHRFVDVMESVPGARMVIHYDRFHATVPVDAAHRVPWLP